MTPAKDRAREREIAEYRTDIDWEAAETREGKSHGAVVSVRLDASDAERLRKIASDLDLTMSQVLRRALANFDPADELHEHLQTALRSYLTAFTFGGTSFVGHVHVLPQGADDGLEFPESKTVDARVRERIPG